MQQYLIDWVNACFHQTHLVKVGSVVPIVVWFERAVLVEAQVFGLLVGELRQVGLEGGQMQTGNIFICNAAT